MIHSLDSTELSGRGSRSDALRDVLIDYLTDLCLPAFNEMRAAHGIEPAPPRRGPPVKPEQAEAAADEYWELEKLRSEQARAQKAEWKAIYGRAEKRVRKPSIAKLVERAEETGRRVTSITTPEGTTIRFDEPTPSDATNPWLDDLKVTKQ
jgi:hypothetical protein